MQQLAVDQANSNSNNGSSYGTMESRNDNDNDNIDINNDTSSSLGIITASNRSSSNTNRPPPLASSQHLGASRQYWRDIILGVNDGLVSTFLLVAGVAGGGLGQRDILLTALAGALAGAVSMCAGEFVATKSQNEVMHGEIELERQHIHAFKEDELSELVHLLDLIGIPKHDDDNEQEQVQDSEQQQQQLHSALLEYYRSNPEALLKIMIALEFGVLDKEERSPVWAGLTSCALFLLGSLPSVLPFCFNIADTTIGLIAAALVTCAALLIVGAVKTWATRGNCWQASVENLVIAGVGGGLAYGVGVLFDKILHDHDQ